MKEISRLTDLEIKIMRVLWESTRSLTIQEITEILKEEKLSPQSVTQSVNHLVKKGAAKVDEHILVSNVYARTFSTCFGQEEYMAAEIKRLSKTLFCKRLPDMTNVLVALMENNDGQVIGARDIEAIQKIIDKKKGE